MLFKRRQKPSHIERLRVAVWPRRSWARSYRYLSKRVIRLSASPHVVAVGFACGAAVSCTTLPGFHFILAAITAYILRGNLLASAIGTAVGNPLTFPFLWMSTLKLGNLILGKPVHKSTHAVEMGDHIFNKSFDALWPIMKPMLIGSVPIGIVVGLVFYVIVRVGVQAYQNTRNHRLQLRQKAAEIAARQRARVQKKQNSDNLL
ncbi:DUF2062 domain-containing protein [Rhodobacteraceae bacterium RKSG542]|uniref:DUF2062 domain-containing protein n=1 Tax=Pseudovibrio flavus TaxID=2529854 RepID=UPI0012BB6A66|nr:DUF2062 domain-containing protein [Pseudovibrio flavus]MTI17397.1 DUF2062 domain-containing protein [Pseudovibrio flavus]